LSSPNALQLFGLLCSLLKACSSDASSLLSYSPAESLQQDSSDARTALLVAVSAVVETALSNQSTGTLPGSSNTSSNDACSNASAVLPWLVLLGRCCRAGAVLMLHCQNSVASDDSSTSLQPQQWAVRQHVLANNLWQLQYSLAGVVQWLAADWTVQQLTALGYQPQVLQQQLAVAAEALAALSSDLQAADPFTGDRSAAVAQEQLLAAGRVLACFAIPNACNNPACGNLFGPSEGQIVRGHSCICAGCRTARYYGRACQCATWRQHNPLCKAVAAAAAATRAAAAITS
jgi:hypothetical protein